MVQRQKAAWAFQQVYFVDPNNGSGTSWYNDIYIYIIYICMYSFIFPWKFTADWMQFLVDGNDGFHCLWGKAVCQNFFVLLGEWTGAVIERISLPNWGAIGTPESVESLGRQYRHVELGRMVQTSDAGYLFSHFNCSTWLMCSQCYGFHNELSSSGTFYQPH